MLDNLLAFALYFTSASALFVLFVALYIRITPYAELQLIRAGNSAASIALLGALLGFALPLASAIAHSVSLRDMLIWGLIAMLVQISVYLSVSRLLPELATGIVNGCCAHATFLGGCALCAGVLNAACLVY